MHVNARFRHFHQAKFQQIHQCLPGHDARVHRLWHLGEGAHWSIATRQHREPGFRLMNGQCNQCLHVPRRLCKESSESTIGMIVSCRSAVIQDRQMSFVYQLAQQKKAHHSLSHMTLLRFFLPVGKPLVLQAGRLRFAAGAFATPSSSSNGKG